MKGRKRVYVPTLTPSDQETLRAILSSRTEEVRKVQRAKMIALAVDVKFPKYGTNFKRKNLDWD